MFHVYICLRNPRKINRVSFSRMDHLRSFDVQMHDIKLQKGMQWEELLKLLIIRTFFYGTSVNILGKCL